MDKKGPWLVYHKHGVRQSLWGVADKTTVIICVFLLVLAVGWGSGIHGYEGQYW